MLHVGIVAGEASGDLLGAGLVKAIRDARPDIRVEGVGGQKLADAGCSILFPMDRLAVMGITEVMGHYLQLRNLRTRLIKHFIESKPDVFIGIDAPDFNLGLEKSLRKAGIKTIHFVSPSVWAWREGRMKAIKQSVDLMLSVFPFEEKLYRQHNIPYRFVGHPLADRLPLHPDKLEARRKLGLCEDGRIIAIMPGSRKNELRKLTKPFLQTAVQCNRIDHDIVFITGLVDKTAESYFMEEKKRIAADIPLSVYTGDSHTVMEAADVVLLASGTVALEAMLLKKPMVVAYKLSWLTYTLAKLMLKIPYVSLPNLLVGWRVVPECVQAQCKPERLTTELFKWLNNKVYFDDIERRFVQVHSGLRRDADRQAADAVLDLAR